MTDYAVLDGHEVRHVSDVLEWARWYETADRHVARESVGDVDISTVFLGFDHGYDGPEYFETMTFGPDEQGCWRYGTWGEAEAGHRRVVEALRAGTEP